MVVFKPLLPEDTREGMQNQIKSAFDHKSVTGNILETDVWGKRHLAYELKGYNEGFYIVYKCELEDESTSKFQELLKNNPNILRFILIREENL